MNIVSKCYFLYLNIAGSEKVFHGGPVEVLDFFVSKRVGMLNIAHCICAFDSILRH